MASPEPAFGDAFAPPVPCEVGAVTHAGKIRAINEDSFFVAPELGIFAVADGMGGHEAGEVASTMLVESLASIGPAVSASDLLARLEDRVFRANAALQREAAARGAILGSTLAILLLHGDRFACVWSGDSRIYRVRDERITQITRDHTEARDLVERGLLTAAEAETWKRKNVITRAIGVKPEPELELEHGLLEAGDIFVICSDGLTAHLRAEQILESSLRAAPQAACEALLALTLERGARDNVTVVMVRHRSAAFGASAADGAWG